MSVPACVAQQLVPDPILWMIAHTPHSVGSGIRKIQPQVEGRILISFKLQASSLTVTEGYYRINLERNIMDTEQLKRIADAIEEILRIVKKDMEPRTKKEKN